MSNDIISAYTVPFFERELILIRGPRNVGLDYFIQNFGRGLGKSINFLNLFNFYSTSPLAVIDFF